MDSKSKSYSLFIVAAFFCVGLFAIWYHEPWRDELQAWLIARDTPTLPAFLHTLGYDGHPFLWYAVLYPITRITWNPFAMQFVHLLIATAAVFVFNYYSPLTRLQKILFTFGYFPIYEYATISRNYALGVLLVFCFCAMKRDTTWRYVVLALLANTSAYGLLISFALLLLITAETQRKQRITGILIYCVGVAASVWIMKGVSDSGNVLDWRFAGRLIDVGLATGVIWRGYFPIPSELTYFWNKNIVTSWQLGAALALIVLLASAFMLRRAKMLLFVYLIGVGSIVAFTYVKFYGSVRHHGHVFILFVACYWLLRQTRPQTQRERHLITSFRILHVALAVIALRADFIHPFSNSQKVANYLRANGMQNMYIVADRDTVVSPITAYLNRPIYYPRGDREGTYIIWDKTRANAPAYDSFTIARQKALALHQPVLVITNTPQPNMTSLVEFNGSITEDENYYLYLLTP